METQRQVSSCSSSSIGYDCYAPSGNVFSAFHFYFFFNFVIVLFQHYETLLSEAKVKREVSISKRKEMADYEMRKLQDEIEEAVKETKVIASVSSLQDFKLKKWNINFFDFCSYYL